MDGQAFASVVTGALAAKGGIVTPFGLFFAHHTKAYAGQNPRTGGRIDIPEKWLPRFIPAESFLSAVFGDTPRRHEPEYRAEIVSELPPSVEGDVAPALYDSVVAALRANREVKLETLGRFVVGEKREGIAILTFHSSQSFNSAVHPTGEPW